MNIFKNVSPGQEFTTYNGNKVTYVGVELDDIHIVSDSKSEYYVLEDGSCFDPFPCATCDYHGYSINTKK